jgi:hypothetical protein
MENYRKLIAVALTALMSVLVTKFGFPAEWSTPESIMIQSITGVIASVLVWRFPNTPPA